MTPIALAQLALAAAFALPAAPAAAGTVTLGNHEIVIAGALEEADRVHFAQALGRWLTGTGRADLVVRLDAVSGDAETAKRILRFLAGMMEAGLRLEVVTEPGQDCPAACAVLRDGYDDPAFIAGLDAYRGYRIQLYDGRWVAAPTGRSQ